MGTTQVVLQEHRLGDAVTWSVSIKDFVDHTDTSSEFVQEFGDIIQEEVFPGVAEGSEISDE